MTYRQETGKSGENLAANYLRKNGYRIIERNKKEKWGELDIIAVAPDKTLVFVEVKTIRKNQNVDSDDQLRPEDQMTQSKMDKFGRTATLYAGSHRELVDDEKGWRLDVLALTEMDDGDFKISHYENV